MFDFMKNQCLMPTCFLLHSKIKQVAIVEIFSLSSLYNIGLSPFLSFFSKNRSVLGIKMLIIFTLTLTFVMDLHIYILNQEAIFMEVI